MKTAPKSTYKDYKHIQISRSDRKWNSSTFWNNVYTFKLIINDILSMIDIPKSICCMGIRNGNEYVAFKELYSLKNTALYGVDINPKVTEVGTNCYCFDFTKLPKEWENKFDLVYSNSLDHALNVQKTLKEWHRVCRGYLVLGMSSGTGVSLSDRNSFEIDDIDDLFNDDLFQVIKVWDRIDKMHEFTVLLKVK
jgi:hypothetical protein